jgi:hypothetical protein
MNYRVEIRLIEFDGNVTDLCVEKYKTIDEVRFYTNTDSQARDIFSNARMAARDTTSK